MATTGAAGSTCLYPGRGRGLAGQASGTLRAEGHVPYPGAPRVRPVGLPSPRRPGGPSARPRLLRRLAKCTSPASFRGPHGLIASAADVPRLCRALRTTLEGLEMAHEDGATDAHDVIEKALSELERDRPVDGGYERRRQAGRA